MKSWVIRGLRKGVLTTRFPKGDAEDVPLWTTKPVKMSDGEVRCPAGAISDGAVDMNRCISCRRCSEHYMPDGRPVHSTVNSGISIASRSFHIYMIDTGSCGACNSEVHSLHNPVYDFNRLGMFVTNTPRHADALIVVGVVSEGMEMALKAAYEAMPSPKIVIATGTCSISGGIIGKGVDGVLPADVLVPGCPPSPYAILDALIRARDAK